MQEESLTIVIPAYNEEACIVPLVRSLHQVLLSAVKDFKIIVIDDGSDDSTYSKITELTAELKRISVIQHNLNRGFGASLRTGASYVKTNYWGWLPGDGEIDPLELIKLFKHIGQKDVIIGVPIGDEKVRNFYRRILSKSYQALLRSLFQKPISYFNGPVLYRTRPECLQDLVSVGFATTAEILLRHVSAEEINATVEVPVQLSPRLAGKSKAIRWQVMVGLAMDWPRIWLRARRKWAAS